MLFCILFKYLNVRGGGGRGKGLVEEVKGEGMGMKLKYFVTEVGKHFLGEKEWRSRDNTRVKNLYQNLVKLQCTGTGTGSGKSGTGMRDIRHFFRGLGSGPSLVIPFKIKRNHPKIYLFLLFSYLTKIYLGMKSTEEAKAINILKMMTKTN